MVVPVLIFPTHSTNNIYIVTVILQQDIFLIKKKYGIDDYLMPVPMLAAAVETSSNVILPVDEDTTTNNNNNNNDDGAAAGAVAAAVPDSDVAIASLGQGMASVAINGGNNNDDDVDVDDDDDEEGADKEFTDALRDGRVKGGCCVNCGTKLFSTKRMGLLGRKKRYKPLTIPGRVLRGQCLNCAGTKNALHRVDIDSEMAAAVALSAMNDNNDDDDQAANTDAAPTMAVATLAADPGTTSAIQQLEATYKGSFNNYGERHGQGDLAWSNGDRYKGSFIAGIREGQGTLFFNDGTYTHDTSLSCFLVHVDNNYSHSCV